MAATFVPRQIKELDDARGVSLTTGFVPVYDGVKFTPRTLTSGDVGGGFDGSFSSLTGKPTTLSGYGITDGQPLDGDLTSLSGATGTNTIYYRSAPSTWSGVTVGTGLSFSGGTLTNTAGGGTIAATTNILVGDGVGNAADSAKAVPSGTIVGTTDSQTLTNKTLTSPAISTPTGIVKGDVGLGSVTNDAQTKASVVPNTAPTAGQILAGNVGGTAYAPVSVSGSGATVTLSSAGLLTISSIANATLSNSAITIAGSSTSLGGSITLDTISGVSSNGFLKRTGANTWTNDSNTYLIGNQTVTLSGDVTGSGSTAITTALGNIPSATPMAGSLLATAVTAPATPATGKASIYVDSTSKNVCVKNDAGTVIHGVQTNTGATSNFLTAISDAGVVSRAQPAFSDISGTATTGQIPTLNQNTTGSAASLSISGQTGLMTVTGLTSVNRAKTVRDAADTILELGGSYTPTGTWTSLNMVTPVLGTPTSGTLTNCTFPTLNQNSTGSAASLSISGQTGLLTFTGLASTNRAKTVRDAADTVLELGGSYTPTGTWTSLTMVTPVLGTPTSGTLNNCTGSPKPRVNSQASATSFTANFDSYDMEIQTALAGAITMNAPTYTGTAEVTRRMRIKDNGTARAITWTTGSTGAFRASSDLALPTTTIISKTLYMIFIWNNTDSRWDLLAFLNNFT
jgi:hypothetical protein